MSSVAWADQVDPSQATDATPPNSGGGNEDDIVLVGRTDSGEDVTQTTIESPEVKDDAYLLNPFEDEVPMDEIDKVERENKLLKSKVNELQSQVIKYQLDLGANMSAAEIERMKARHQQEIDDFKKKLKEARNAAERSRRQSRTEVAKLVQTETQLEEYKEELNKKEEEIAVHQRRISSQKEQYEHEVHQLEIERNRAEREKRQIESSLRQDLSLMQEKHQAEIDKLKERLHRAAASSSTPGQSDKIMELHSTLETMDAEHQEDIENLIGEHEQEVREIRAELNLRIDSLETENSHLRDELRRAREETKTLKNENRELAKGSVKINSMTRELNSAQQQIDRYESELRKAKAEADGISADMERINAEKTALEAELAALQEDGPSNRRQGSVVIQQDASGNKQIMIIRNEDETPQGKHTLRQSMTELSDRYVQEVEQLRREVRVSKEEHRQMFEEVESLTTEKQRQILKLARYQKQLNDQKVKHKNEVAALNQKISELEKDAKERQKAVGKLKLKFQEELDLKDEDLTEALAKNEDLNAQLDGLENNVTFLENEREQQMKRIEELESSNAELEDLRTGYEEELDTTDEELQKCADMIDSLQQELRQAKDALDKQRADVNFHVTELRETRQELHHAKSDSIILEEQKKSLLQQLDTLKKDSQEKDTIIRRQSVKITEVQEMVRKEPSPSPSPSPIPPPKPVNVEPPPEIIREIENKLQRKISQQLEQEYIIKISEERTRAESMAQTSKEMERSLMEGQNEIDTLRSRVKSLEGELSRAIESKSALLNAFSLEMERWREQIRQANLARPVA